MLSSPPVAATPCQVCGESSGGVPTLAALRECRACGFVFFSAPNPAELEQLYDERYFRGGDYPDYLGQQRAIRRSMRRHLEQMARVQPLCGALLEVGCAYGLFLDEARRHFANVTGIDICAEGIDYAREVLGLNARRGNLLTEDFQEQPFDVCCMWDTIEHLTTPDEFLLRAAVLLRPGGLVFLTTGDIGSWNARFRGSAWRQIRPPSHVNYCSRRTLSRLLDRAGFDVVRIETAAYYHTLYNVAASIILHDRALAPAARATLSLVGEDRARRTGLWINLGDIMFIAARKRSPTSARRDAPIGRPRIRSSRRNGAHTPD